MNTRRSGGSGAHHGSDNSSSAASVPESKPDNYLVNAKICRLVAQYPCMYDRSNPHYLKKDVVDRAWVKIAKEMNDTILSCKERWRNIRTSFARSINVNKIPASANRTKPYYLHEELKFLAQHITPGVPVPRRAQKSFGSMGDESEEIKVSMSEESFDSFAALTHNAMEEEEHDDSHESQQDDGSSTDEPPASSVSNSRDYQTSPQDSRTPTQTLEIEANVMATAPTMSAAAAATAAAVVTAANVTEVAPMMVQPVCPCPPKKRQRLIEVFTPDIELSTTHETDVKTIYANNTSNANGNNSSTTSAQQTESSSRLGSVPDIDFDDAFLQGLRPEMKAMNFHQKLYFKRRVYDVLGEIFTHTPTLNGGQQASEAEASHNATPVTTNSTTQPVTTQTPEINIDNLTATGINWASVDPNLMRRLQILLHPPLAQQPLAPPIIALPKINANSQSVNSNSAFQYGSANSASAAAAAAASTGSTISMPPRLRTISRLGSNLMRVRLMGSNQCATSSSSPVNGTVQHFPLKEEAMDD